MKKIIPVLILSFAATMASTPACAQSNAANTASVAGITAEISVPKVADGSHVLSVRYLHSGSSCASYRDLRLHLADAGGHVVHFDETALASATIADYQGPIYAGMKGPCSQKIVVLLSRVYPRLQPGTYTLSVTLAPHGSVHSAQFAPTMIVVQRQGPP